MKARVVEESKLSRWNVRSTIVLDLLTSLLILTFLVYSLFFKGPFAFPHFNIQKISLGRSLFALQLSQRSLPLKTPLAVLFKSVARRILYSTRQQISNIRTLACDNFVHVIAYWICARGIIGSSLDAFPLFPDCIFLYKYFPRVHEYRTKRCRRPPEILLDICAPGRIGRVRG